MTFFSKRISALAGTTTTELTPFWFLLALIGVEMLWAEYLGIPLTELLPAFFFVSAPTALGLMLNAIGTLERVANSLYSFSFWLGNILFGSVFTYLAAALSFPLLDTAFHDIDRLFGFDWMAWYTFQHAYPVLEYMLGVAYWTISPQILFAIIYFSHPARRTAASDLWWTSMIALIITSIVSGILPALGTFHTYGVLLNKAVHLPDLLAIRDGAMKMLPILQLKGIITLPSYHAVMAILLAWSYRHQRFMFPLACSLNAVMLVSVPIHGGHYLIDVLSGCAVALLTILMYNAMKARAVQRQQCSSVPKSDMLMCPSPFDTI